MFLCAVGTSVGTTNKQSFFFCYEREQGEGSSALSNTQDSSQCTESKEWKKKDSPGNSFGSLWPLDLHLGIGKFQNQFLGQIMVGRKGLVKLT